MHFGGVFRVIFKNYLLPQFTFDSRIACGFANFWAISKSYRGRIVQFCPSFGFMGLWSWLLEVFRMTVDVTSMDSSTLSSQTMLMKLGYNVYWDTTISHNENDPHASTTHNATWRKLGIFSWFWALSAHISIVSQPMWMKLGYNVYGDTTTRHMENDPLAPSTYYATWRKLGVFHDFERFLLISPSFLSRCGWNLATMCMGIQQLATWRMTPSRPLLTTPPGGNLDFFMIFSTFCSYIHRFSADVDETETWLQCMGMQQLATWRITPLRPLAKLSLFMFSCIATVRVAKSYVIPHPFKLVSFK